jgi:hypothetical protein
VIGNAIAARVRLAGGWRLDGPALVADGNHARSDAIVSLGVILSALVVALGAPIADPLVGLAIAALILRITWESWQTVRGRRHRHWSWRRRLVHRLRGCCGCRWPLRSPRRRPSCPRATAQDRRALDPRRDDLIGLPSTWVVARIAWRVT